MDQQIKPVETEQVRVNNIREWRNNLLASIARNISAVKDHRENQKEIAVWKHGGQLPYPTLDTIKITASESLTFPAMIGKYGIMFSVWVMLGEVRIGVQVPNPLVMTQVAENKVSTAYDGKPCSRLSKTDKDMLFDWIWQDREFASFNFMSEALYNEDNTAVLIDRMTQVLLHLYLSVTNGLMEAHRLTASHGIISNTEFDHYRIEFTKDQDTFEWAATVLMKGRINSITSIKEKRGEYEFDRFIASVLLPKEKQAGMFKEGAYIKDSDGGICEILVVKKLEAENTTSQPAKELA